MDGLSLESMPLERIEAEITEGAGHLAAAECRWLLFAAEFDRREGWKVWGCRGCTQWLSWRCGIDPRTAREKLRVAHGLSLFPRIREEFAKGRLSYSKARALIRVAGPDTEEELVGMALHATAAHVEAISRGYRRVQRAEDRANGIDPARGRRVDFVADDEDPNLGVIIARVTVEEQALVRTALVAAGDDRSIADALVLMAESFLANGAACRTGRERAQLQVNVDESMLLGDDTGKVTIDGNAIAPETARRLACDATFTWLLRDENGEPIDISTKHANIPRQLRRLVSARDAGCCRFPGCAEDRYTDVHHIVHRADGGTHDPSNLVTLCWFHHRLVHEGGWSIERDDDTGEIVAITLDGQPLTGDVSATIDATADDIAQSNSEYGLDIHADTAVPMWGGESLDLGWAVTSLWYANHPEQLAAEVAA